MTAARAVCATCRRPEVVCYCRHVAVIPTRTRVVIFQHTRERDVAINTARIASLCLPNAEIRVGVRFDGASLARALGDASRPPVLLYPGPSAIDVEARPPSGPVTLVVVDGTWWQAKKILRENPALAALPRYAFRPAAPSEYRIRREPQNDFVSTIEALAHVLGVLEGDRTRAQAMLAPFRAMVDAQIAYARARGAAPRVYTRKRVGPVDPRERLPPLLRTSSRDLVCVYAESNAWPYFSDERARYGEELVQWVAWRASTDETFEAFVRPRGPIAPSTARHLGVPADVLAGGEDGGAFLARWRAFGRPNDVLCAWGPNALALLRRAGGAEDDAPWVDLRSAARLFARARVGATEELAARLGIDAPAPRGRGRAGERLARIVGIARALARG